MHKEKTIIWKTALIMNRYSKHLLAMAFNWYLQVLSLSPRAGVVDEGTHTAEETSAAVPSVHDM